MADEFIEEAAEWEEAVKEDIEYHWQNNNEALEDPLIPDDAKPAQYCNMSAKPRSNSALSFIGKLKAARAKKLEREQSIRDSETANPVTAAASYKHVRQQLQQPQAPSPVQQQQHTKTLPSSCPLTPAQLYKKIAVQTATAADIGAFIKCRAGSQWWEKEHHGGRTLLQAAIDAGNIDACMELLNHYREQPGPVISVDDFLRCIKKDLGKVCADMLHCRPTLCSDCDLTGHSAFKVAFTHNASSIFDVLLPYGRDGLHKCSNRGANNLLHWAVQERLADAVVWLVERSEIDINQANKKGDTALHIACRRGHLVCVNRLLAAGADLTLRNKEGSTALHIAIDKGHDEIRSALLHRYGERETDDSERLNFCKHSLLTNLINLTIQSGLLEQKTDLTQQLVVLFCKQISNLIRDGAQLRSEGLKLGAEVLSLTDINEFQTLIDKDIWQDFKWMLTEFYLPSQNNDRNIESVQVNAQAIIQDWQKEKNLAKEQDLWEIDVLIRAIKEGKNYSQTILVDDEDDESYEGYESYEADEDNGPMNVLRVLLLALYRRGGVAVNLARRTAALLLAGVDANQLISIPKEPARSRSTVALAAGLAFSHSESPRLVQGLGEIVSVFYQHGGRFIITYAGEQQPYQPNNREQCLSETEKRVFDCVDDDCRAQLETMYLKYSAYCQQNPWAAEIDSGYVELGDAGLAAAAADDDLEAETTVAEEGGLKFNS